MKNMLKLIKNGAYANVVDYDKHNNLITTQLRFNNVSHRFYLSDDERGYVREVITRKEAMRRISHTLYLISNV